MPFSGDLYNLFYSLSYKEMKDSISIKKFVIKHRYKEKSYVRVVVYTFQSIWHLNFLYDVEFDD